MGNLIKFLMFVIFLYGVLWVIQYVNVGDKQDISTKNGTDSIERIVK